MPYVGFEVLDLLAQSRNWRGWRMPDLICQLQYVQDKAETAKSCPFLLEKIVPEECSLEEYAEGLVHYWEAEAKSILTEIERRERASRFIHPDRPTLVAIKERAGAAGLIDMMIECGVDVLTGRNSQKIVKFRCTLHGDGQDNTPAGVIYQDDLRWWCFVCNRGGDIFNAVSLYGKVPIGEAIGRVSRYVGIDPRPLRPLATSNPRGKTYAHA